MSGATIYVTWMNMRMRCENAKNTHYRNYGGRGITVCERWKTFENFLADMGERPLGPTQFEIDRINNDGNYEPSNCRWATYAEQRRNNSYTRLLEFRDETLCVTDWAKKLGIHKDTLFGRLRNGWSIEQALSCPFRVTKHDQRGERHK